MIARSQGTVLLVRRTVDLHSYSVDVSTIVLVLEVTDPYFAEIW